MGKGNPYIKIDGEEYVKRKAFDSILENFNSSYFENKKLERSLEKKEKALLKLVERDGEKSLEISELKGEIVFLKDIIRALT